MNITIEASEVTEVGLLVQLLRYFGARFKLDGLRNEEMKSGLVDDVLETVRVNSVQ